MIVFEKVTITIQPPAIVNVCVCKLIYAYDGIEHPEST